MEGEGRFGCLTFEATNTVSRSRRSMKISFFWSVCVCTCMRMCVRACVRYTFISKLTHVCIHNTTCTCTVVYRSANSYMYTCRFCQGPLHQHTCTCIYTYNVQMYIYIYSWAGHETPLGRARDRPDWGWSRWACWRRYWGGCGFLQGHHSPVSASARR